MTKNVNTRNRNIQGMYNSSMTAREIAQKNKVSVSTVYRTLHRIQDEYNGAGDLGDYINWHNYARDNLKKIKSKTPLVLNPTLEVKDEEVSENRPRRYRMAGMVNIGGVVDTVKTLGHVTGFGRSHTHVPEGNGPHMEYPFEQPVTNDSMDIALKGAQRQVGMKKRRLFSSVAAGFLGLWASLAVVNYASKSYNSKVANLSPMAQYVSPSIENTESKTRKDGLGHRLVEQELDQGVFSIGKSNIQTIPLVATTTPSNIPLDKTLDDVVSGTRPTTRPAESPSQDSLVFYKDRVMPISEAVKDKEYNGARSDQELKERDLNNSGGSRLGIKELSGIPTSGNDSKPLDKYDLLGDMKECVEYQLNITTPNSGKNMELVGYHFGEALDGIGNAITLSANTNSSHKNNDGECVLHPFGRVFKRFWEAPGGLVRLITKEKTPAHVKVTGFVIDQVEDLGNMFTGSHFDNFAGPLVDQTFPNTIEATGNAAMAGTNLIQPVSPLVADSARVTIRYGMNVSEGK